MKISIVVPAFNEERLLGESLEHMGRACAAFDRIGWTWEIVVCDNASTDATARIAQAAGALVVHEPVNQIARARNTGAAAATGEWIVFVDADSHPSGALFAETAACIQSGRVLAGGSTVSLDENLPAARFACLLWNAVSRAGRWLAGSFIFVEAAAFRALGGFSQSYYAGEELELSVRLKRAARSSGRRVVVLHRHPLRTSARKAHLYSKMDHFRLLLRVLFDRSTLTRRQSCTLWYDGRR